MNDWNTQQKALLPGARSANVGTPSGMVLARKAKSGTKLAGNWLGPIPAWEANCWFGPCPAKLTK